MHRCFRGRIYGRGAAAAGMLLVALVLAGCSSSGSSRPPASEDPPWEPPAEVDGVRVAVLDAEFRVSHQEFDGRIASLYNVVSGDDDMAAPEGSHPGHGTPVAALAAGNTFGTDGGDAWLDLVRVTEDPDGNIQGRHVRDGVKYATSVGARVLNLSLAPVPPILDDADTVDSIREVGDHGAVVVFAAGNSGGEGHSGGSLSDPDTRHGFDPDTLEHLWDIRKQLIIAGASDGDELAEFSDYPGENEDIQARFLVAPGVDEESASNKSDDAIGTFSGTSFASPQIAGAAAALLAEWPDLSAEEVSGLLLDNADRDVALYDRNDCGEDEDLNCGEYYLGQGHLDIEAAFEPDGEVTLATADTVEGDRQALTDSQVAWSSSFGGGLDPAALAGVVGFDALGRDYALDLSAHSRALELHGQRLGERVQRLAAAGPNPQVLDHELVPGLTLTSHHGAGGAVGASELRFAAAGMELTAFGFHQGETALLDPWAPDGSMAMLSEGSGGLTHLLDHGGGFGARLPLAERVRLRVGHWAGFADDAGERLYRGYRQIRTDVALGFDATAALELEIGYGQRREHGGVLGSAGSGALAPGEATTTDLLHAGARLAVGDHFALLARHEHGRADVSGGAGLIRAIDGLTTQQSSLGLAFERADHEAVLLVSRPLRVTGGTAQLDIPVGRDTDGRVIRESRSAELAAGGRQQDIELGYAWGPDPRRRLELNLLYSAAPDHHSGSAVAGVVTHTRRF